MLQVHTEFVGNMENTSLEGLVQKLAESKGTGKERPGNTPGSQHTTTQHNPLQHNPLQHNPLQHNTLQHNTLQMKPKR